MTADDIQLIDQLNEALYQVKQQFVGKDDIIDLMGICLTGRENLFLLGPPGTAKSAMVHQLASMLNGHTFEYLLTRFTEPNELFGPFDIRKLREGQLVTNTEGMLPEATFIFLDELLNANSAILNSLLMVLNERVFRRGRETRPLPALMIVGASNHLPEDDALQALFDRFLIRVQCDNIDPTLLEQVLGAGWKLEQAETQEKQQTIEPESIRHLQGMVHSVNLSPIRTAYLDLIQKLRNAGVRVSDRRAVKLQRLIAASALLCKRQTAIPSDLWVMRYIWDTDQQREIIAGIVNTVTEADTSPEAKHPMATQQQPPNADDLFEEVEAMATQWAKDDLPLADRAILKDRLRHLNGRCAWIQNETQRAHVQQAIDSLWTTILQQA